MDSYENPDMSYLCDITAENGRLKAINAELVAALERIALEAEREDTNPASICNRISEQARTAIAKAKGE